MTQPITSPEMLIMQERLRALARETNAVADEIEHSNVVDDPEYTAGMLRLQATQLLEQADQLEDDDDLRKLNVFATRQELEIARLRTNIAKADEANQKVERYTRKEVFWRWVVLAVGGIILLNLGFQAGRLVAGL